ncbi:MAG: signal peptidase I [Treponema sp.]|jgi:signal peptidase I|nr:signal peptidase I [Treponema sp.]
MLQKAQKTDFFDRIQLTTEKYLTYRKRVRRVSREKRKKKGFVIDTLEAILWAMGMVLLINQYFIQAYRIPSGSMIDTLNIGDHIFVNKIVYGPELLPGFVKLPSPITPKRNDIIIFESPEYESRGTVFDVAQRIIYMMTLSMIDIDKDQAGNPRVHFLIKRAVGQAGDRFIIENGEMKICFSGEDRWVNERDYNAKQGWEHRINRLMKEDQYPSLVAAGKVTGWTNRGINASDRLRMKASPEREVYNPDFFAHELARLETLRKASPHDSRYLMLLAKQSLGWYVPEGRVFPLGDNRDNSRDGRSFGPVRVTRVLGKGMIIYLPPSRWSNIK